MDANLDQLARLLTVPEEEHRRRAAAALRGHQHPRALSLALQALGDESWRVRKEAGSVLAGWPDSEAVVTALLAALGQPGNAGQRNAAAEVLAELGDVALRAVFVATEVPDQDTRKFAVEILGAMKDPRAVVPLVRRLADEDTNVRGAAAEAIGHVGGQEGREALEAALDQEDITTRIAALSALVDLGAPLSAARLDDLAREPLLHRELLRHVARSPELSMLPLVIENLVGQRKSLAAAGAIALAALADTFADRDPEAAQTLHRALAEHGDAIEGSLAHLLHHPDPDVQRAAISCVAWTNAASSLEELLEIGDTDEPIRDATIDTLTRLGERALPTLRAEATEGNSSSRRAFALERLGEMGDESSLPLVMSALHDEEPDIVLAAIRATGALQRPEAIESLLQLLQDGGEPTSRAAGGALARIGLHAHGAVRDALRVDPLESVPWLGAMSTVGTGEDISLVGRALHAEEADVRAAAADALGNIANRTGADVERELRFALADEDSAVRSVAARALGRAGSGAEALHTALHDGSPHVRAEAARALGALGDPSAVPALEERIGDSEGLPAIAAVEALVRLAPHKAQVLAGALAHPSSEVRKAALTALGRGGGGDPGAARRLVVQALRDPHWDVRRAAAQATAAMGIPSAAELLIERRDKEQDNLVRRAIDDALHSLSGDEPSPPGDGPGSQG